VKSKVIQLHQESLMQVCPLCDGEDWKHEVVKVPNKRTGPFVVELLIICADPACAFGFYATLSDIEKPDMEVKK